MSTTTLLVVAKWFVYVIDRTDCILYYRLVKMRVQFEKCTSFILGSWAYFHVFCVYSVACL